MVNVKLLLLEMAGIGWTAHVAASQIGIRVPRISVAPTETNSIVRDLAHT